MKNTKNIYIRQVEKSRIPTCNIMGVNIAAINMQWLLNFTRKHIKELSGDYMCVSNVHTTVTAYEDPQYRKVQNSAVMSIPDGGPLSILGRKRGYKDMDRTTGPSYMGEVLKMGLQYGYRHYFYGSTEETLKRLYDVLKRDYPDIQIVGMYSPPFRPLIESEDNVIVKQINASNPDFVWVGLGAPKQERWMEVHQGEINGFMVGVGAAFDYFAGNIKRAPKWMQKCSLEWMYRIMQEPKRLFKRYMTTNSKFIWHAVLRGK